MLARFTLIALSWSVVTSVAFALPMGYQKHTISVNGPPSGLAFAPNGTLFALEAPDSGTSAIIRVINADYSFGPNLQLTGMDPAKFFFGGMAYDPVTSGVVVTDNAPGADAIYALSPNGVQVTLSSGIGDIAGVAVRSTGEIFVSTAPSLAGQGKVLQVDRSTGSTTTILEGLDYGAGLAFDNNEHLIVQDADFNTYAGRLQRVPITEAGGSLLFGPTEFLIAGMTAGAGITVDSEGDFFVTGSGGLYEAKGDPLLTENFDSNGNQFQFSTGISFLAGNAPFEPFAGGGAKLAFLSDFGFAQEDFFVTIVTPVPEPTTATLLFIAAAGVGRRRRAWSTVLTSLRRRRE